MSKLFYKRIYEYLWETYEFLWQIDTSTYPIRSQYLLQLWSKDMYCVVKVADFSKKCIVWGWPCPRTIHFYGKNPKISRTFNLPDLWGLPSWYLGLSVKKFRCLATSLQVHVTTLYTSEYLLLFLLIVGHYWCSTRLDIQCLSCNCPLLVWKVIVYL